MHGDGPRIGLLDATDDLAAQLLDVRCPHGELLHGYGDLRQIPAFGDPSLAFLSGLRLLAAFLLIRLVWFAQEATGPAVLRALALMVHPYPDVERFIARYGKGRDDYTKATCAFASESTTVRHGATRLRP